MINEQIVHTSTVVPGDNQILVVWDTTRMGRLVGAGVAAGHASLIPSTDRGMFPFGVMDGFVLCTGQDVTAKFYRRLEYDNDANDWQIDTAAPGAGSRTVTAGVATAWPFQWRTGGGETLFRIDAGGTAPTTLVVVYTWTPSADFGV